MSDLVFVDNGRIRRATDVELAEKIVDARNKKDPWVVIDQLVQAWIKKAPEEVEAAKINIADTRETLADQKFGQTKGGGDFQRRLTILFPTNLMLLIRTQFKSDELPFDSKFYKEFIKRYPKFLVPQKI